MKTTSEERDIQDTANGFCVAVRDTLGSLLGSMMHSDAFSAEHSLWHPCYTVLVLVLYTKSLVF